METKRERVDLPNQDLWPTPRILLTLNYQHTGTSRARQALSMKGMTGRWVTLSQQVGNQPSHNEGFIVQPTNS